jgi:hypothetical protein
MLGVNVALVESEVFQIHHRDFIFRSSAGLLSPFRDQSFPGCGDMPIGNDSVVCRGLKDGVERWDISDDSQSGSSICAIESTGGFRTGSN